MGLPVQASLAAQVAAQARPISITPIRPSTLPPSTAPISLADLDKRFRLLVAQAKNVWAESAFVAFRIWKAEDWGRLGCRDMESYCDSLGITKEHWRHLVTYGERMQHLTLQEMQGLSYGAIQALVKVIPSIWHEYAWVEEAKALCTKEFLALVAERNQSAVQGLFLKEPRCTFSLRVPVRQHPVFERRLETIRRQEKLGSTAEALTFALESVDRADLMADTLAEIQRQVGELSRIQESLKESQSEKEARFESGTDSGSAARVKAQKLTASILRTIGESNAVCKEEVCAPNPGASISAV